MLLPNRPRLDCRVSGLVISLCRNHDIHKTGCFYSVISSYLGVFFGGIDDFDERCDGVNDLHQLHAQSDPLRFPIGTVQKSIHSGIQMRRKYKIRIADGQSSLFTEEAEEQPICKQEAVWGG